MDNKSAIGSTFKYYFLSYKPVFSKEIYFRLKFKYLYMSLYRALLLKEINIV